MFFIIGAIVVTDILLMLHFSLEMLLIVIKQTHLCWIVKVTDSTSLLHSQIWDSIGALSNTQFCNMSSSLLVSSITITDAITVEDKDLLIQIIETKVVG